MKEYRLNKEGFHAKLQIWVFGHIPYENNFCPYFWLTIFCILFSPLVLVYKGFLKLGRRFVKFLDWYEEKLCLPALDKKLDAMAGWLIFKMFWHSDGQGDYFKQKYSKYYRRWKMSHPKDWEKLLEQYRKEYQEYLAEKETKQKKMEAKRKNIYLTIIKYTKWLAPIMVLSVLGGAVYGWYSLFAWLDWREWEWLSLLKLFGSMFIIGFSGAATGMAMERCSWRVNIFKPFQLIGRGLINFFAFFVLFFKTFKDQHCPGIVWEKEKDG